MTIEAKPVVKNKFWILEENGIKIATLQATRENIVLVKDQERIPFTAQSELENKYKIKFTKIPRSKKTAINEIAGFSTDCVPYNILYDVKKKIPIYTKTKKSKSFYCAGWYLIRYDNSWNIEYCPKKIFLERNFFHGPYVTKDIVLEKLNTINR